MTHDPLADIQRARILDSLAAVLDEHGFAGATVGTVCARAKVSTRTFYALFDGREQCVLALLDESYRQIRRRASQALRDVHTVRRESDRPGSEAADDDAANTARANIARLKTIVRAILTERSTASPVEIPTVLRDPRAHRARGCLRYLAENPGASNRQIADGIGIARHDQASTLLSRLAAAGLLAKQPGAPGLPNAWTLTGHGVQVALALGAEATLDPRAAQSPVIQEVEFTPASSTHVPGTHEFDIANSTHVPVTHRNAKGRSVKHLDRP